MKLVVSKNVDLVFNKYPEEVRGKLKNLRRLILETASEIEGLQELEETLKWGEPSYLAKKGSTVRIDWKKAKPTQYAIYFKCTSKLVSTFKTIYPRKFKYEGNRAIVFDLEEKVPAKELKHCISMALAYHSLKHLPLLGQKAASKT